jgi:hypothetical protein
MVEVLSTPTSREGVGQIRFVGEGRARRRTTRVPAFRLELSAC